MCSPTEIAATAECELPEAIESADNSDFTTDIGWFRGMNSAYRAENADDSGSDERRQSLAAENFAKPAGSSQPPPSP